MANANEQQATNQQIEELMAAHETIRIRCTIRGRNYLACGFLKAGEPSVPGQTMLDRTKVEGTTAIDDGEWTHLRKYREDFAEYPELDPFYLVTERRDPDLSAGYVSSFSPDDAERYELSSPVRVDWDGRALVLRHCP